MLIEKIKQSIDFKPFANLKDWNEFVVTTPSHTFFNYFNLKIVDGYIVMTVVRNKKDDILLDSFLEQLPNLDINIPKILSKSPL